MYTCIHVYTQPIQYKQYMTSYSIHYYHTHTCGVEQVDVAEAPYRVVGHQGEAVFGGQGGQSTYVYTVD